MKIAGLLPLKIDPEKSMIDRASKDIVGVCDEFIILHDHPEFSVNFYEVTPTEQMTVFWGDGVWSDWANRMTLLARAAKYGCRWVMWLDDDETLGPSLTRERVHEICETADQQGAVVVTVKVKTAWSDTHWRTDGIFGHQIKPLFQVNPLMLKNPNFLHTVERRLHFFPRLEGPDMSVEDHIVHWGMRTRSLREKNVAKYAASDPKNEFSAVPYDYLLDESGMTLEPL